ncbi:MAG TPA: NAD(P)-binding domain-containing protein, partial [Eubacteriales bacterium]|nr:NAD(P)-binding domain-containing protein [Eubacteriales bacterium]
MKIVIFGLGLIGGSLGRAAVKKTGHTVLGFDISEAARLKAKLLGAVHADVTEENIGEADLVIFALNPSAAVKAMNDTVKKLKDGA